MARLDALDLVSRKILAGKMRGERRSKRRGQSVEFADFRNYVEGDDLRFVDWNIYARLDRLFIKLFLEEEDLSLHLLIDTSKSMGFGNPQKLDYARRLVAAIGYVGLVNYNRVTITALGSETPKSTGGMRGRSRVQHMLRFLEDLAPDGAAPLSESCRRFALMNRSKGVAVMASDFFDKSGFDAGLKYVLSGRYDVFALQTLSPQEVEPPLTGDLRLKDVEDNDTAEVSITAPLIEKYKANLSAYCLSLKNYVSARGGTYLFAQTTVAFETVVLGYLRQKRLLG